MDTVSDLSILLRLTKIVLLLFLVERQSFQKKIITEIGF